MNRTEFLKKIKENLQKAYGERFMGLVLYGSEVRGEAGQDSDIDLLVLLDGHIDLGNDIKTNVSALIALELETGRSIHAMSAVLKDYESGRCALYRNAKKEGILL